jgi:hypothetical protein
VCCTSIQSTNIHVFIWFVVQESQQAAEGGVLSDQPGFVAAVVEALAGDVAHDMLADADASEVTFLCTFFYVHFFSVCSILYAFGMCI